MAFSEEPSEQQRQELERERIAWENMSTATVFMCILPFVIFFLLVGIGVGLYLKTGSVACFGLVIFGVVILVGVLRVFCKKFGYICRLRPGQIVTGPDGRPHRFGEPTETSCQEPSQCARPTTRHHHHSHHHTNHPHQSRSLLMKTQQPRLPSQTRQPGQPADQLQNRLMGPGMVPETPPPTYSQVMGRPPGNQFLGFVDRPQPDSRLIEYGNV